MDSCSCTSGTSTILSVSGSQVNMCCISTGPLSDDGRDVKYGFLLEIKSKKYDS